MSQRFDFLKYEWCEGSRHKVDPNVAGRVTKELDDAGMLTAKNLVDVSRPETAPLHDEFEWNDSVAAEKYREDQARYVIRSLRVVIDETKPPERVYCNLEITKPEYTSIEKALRFADTTEMLLRNCRRDAEAFLAKYRHISELAAAVVQLDKFLDETKTAGEPA